MSGIKKIDNTGTELSQYIWKLKEDKIGYDINWKILHKIGNNKNVKANCNTCNLEKYEIAMANKKQKEQPLFELPPFYEIIFQNIDQ